MSASTLRNCTTLLLPGWLNSDPSHWQSRWESLYGFQRVEQDDWQWPRRGDWMARLDEAVSSAARPVVLVAHSLGCQLVAAWAAHSRHTAQVRVAMLVAPPNTETLEGGRWTLRSTGGRTATTTLTWFVQNLPAEGATHQFILDFVGGSPVAGEWVAETNKAVVVAEVWSAGR